MYASSKFAVSRFRFNALRLATFGLANRLFLMGISLLIYDLLIDVHSVRTQLWRKTRLGVKINQHYQYIRGAAVG
jgi:hypothetical protein